MKPQVISFVGRTLAVDAPAEAADTIAAFFALAARRGESAAPSGRAVVSADGPGRFAIAIDGGPSTGGLTLGEVMQRLAAEIEAAPALPAPGVALKAAAVGWSEKAILILGPEGSGKSALAAWMVDRDFAYLADDTVALTGAAGAVAGFPAPPAFNPAKLSHVAGLSTFHDSPSLHAGGRILICPERTWLAGEPSGQASLIVDVRFQEGASLRLDPLPAAAAVLRLLESTRRVVIPTDPEYAPIASLAAQTPALTLTYGSYSQLDGVFDFLVRAIVAAESDPAEVAKFLQALPHGASSPKTYPVPAKTERELHPKLTIGMATYDDFDGVYFTVQAIRMYHPEILDEVEFVVVDNHPDGPCGEPLKRLENAIRNYRYIPMSDTTGTSASRERVFREAGGAFVLCIDCHVLLAPGALKRLLAYFEATPDTIDLLQGPMLSDDLRGVSTHFDEKWSAGMFGTWGHNPAGDDPDGAPFEVRMQGLGLFACRKAIWPGFHPDFLGFGGEEGYLHEKFRQAGGRALCLPFMRWLHRFPRPMGVPYPIRWNDRIRNYLIGFRELGLPLDPVAEHFRTVLGERDADAAVAAIFRELGDAGRQ